VKNILGCLAEQLASRAAELVRDVRIGLGYTAVRLESGATGLAYTLREDLPGGCTVFRGERPLAGRKASDLLAYLASSDKLEVALGLATANALASQMLESAREGDVLDALELRPSDEVAMIGHFEPLTRALERRVRALRVFELGSRAEGVLPGEEAAQWLRSSDVALVTSTALINGTLDALLEAARACRAVVLLGPSTPLFAGAFAGTPVTHLSGVQVTDPDGLLRVVSEGGGMKFFKGLVRKVVLPVERCP
jgi:uncharacterized protein (DUF4213/DUF364 family)